MRNLKFKVIFLQFLIILFVLAFSNSSTLAEKNSLAHNSNIPDLPGTHSSNIPDLPGTHNSNIPDLPGTHNSNIPDLPGTHNSDKQ